MRDLIVRIHKVSSRDGCTFCLLNSKHFTNLLLILLFTLLFLILFAYLSNFCVYLCLLVVFDIPLCLYDFIKVLIGIQFRYVCGLGLLFEAPHHKENYENNSRN